MCNRYSLLVAFLITALFACGRQPTAPTEQSAVPSDERPAEVRAQLDFVPCARGRIEGLWIKNDGSESDGRIEAAWIGARGDTIGLAYGTFWFDTSGGGYGFEATVSGWVLPVVLVEISGTWMFNDPRLCPLCGTGQGLFTGRWIDPRTGRRGRLAGEWGDILLPFAERKMPLSGKWSASCRTAAEIREVDQTN